MSAIPDKTHTRNQSRAFVFLLMVSGAVLGLAGIDLVLPAVPVLPDHLGGNGSLAQLVIAAYVLGTALGFLLFGRLGASCNRHLVLVSALCCFAGLTFVCALVKDIYSLIGLRFFQGIASSAPAVFAPVVIRSLFDEIEATRAMGLLGSIESLAPGAAPVVGVWLLAVAGWQATFLFPALLIFILSLLTLIAGKGIALTERKQMATGSYLALIRSSVYLRYTLSHAFLMAGFLMFVFSAPAVIVHSMAGEMRQFVLMQAIGVACFIGAANTTGLLVRRFGTENIIMGGSVLMALGSFALAIYAWCGGNNPDTLLWLFPVMCIGLGLRGPPGFMRAIMAGGGDDDRASSLAALSITGAAALATALFAPFLQFGLPALSLANSVIQLLAVVLLFLLPKLSE